MEEVTRVRLLVALFFVSVNCDVFTQHNGWEMSAKGYRSFANITEAVCCYKCAVSSDCGAIYYIRKQPTCIFHKGIGIDVMLTKNGVEQNGTFTSVKGCGCGWIYLVSGDHGVPDTSLSASEFDHGYGPEMARLNQTRGWLAPLTLTKDPWIQVRFENIMLVLGITTQGCGFVDESVTEYAVFTSVNEDCTNMVPVTDAFGFIQMYDGNFDGDTWITSWMWTPALARCVRLMPYDWYEGICLRFDVIGRYIIQ